MGSSSNTFWAWACAILLAAGFSLAALPKLMGNAGDIFVHWGYPAWFAPVVGALEMIGVVGLLIPKTTRLAICGLTVIMLGAIYTHWRNGESYELLRPVIYTALLWMIWWFRRSGDSDASESHE